ncbi:MAG: hypothetical protein EOO63_07480 [Hymenobacter sp.]|nr:MAG: hypothetical protein EOO63_07480 [Hymenobacter sp.]
MKCNFRFAPNIAWTATTRGGARLTLPANYFYLPSGALASDTCYLRVREIYSVPDMVLADMPTNTAQPQSLLLSGGEFSIQAWQGAVRLRATGATPNGQLRLLELASSVVAGQDSVGQQLWQQPFLQGGLLGWQTQASYPDVRTQSGLNRASIPLDSLSWWNIDKLWSAYAGASSVATLIEVPVASVGETRVYVRPTGLNGLVRLTASGSAGTQWQASMPLGATMQAIVLQSISGQLYFGTQPFTVRAGAPITPTLTAVSEADAVRLIRQL